VPNRIDSVGVFVLFVYKQIIFNKETIKLQCY